MHAHVCRQLHFALPASRCFQALRVDDCNTRSATMSCAPNVMVVQCMRATAAATAAQPPKSCCMRPSSGTEMRGGVHAALRCRQRDPPHQPSSPACTGPKPAPHLSVNRCQAQHESARASSRAARRRRLDQLAPDQHAPNLAGPSADLVQLGVAQQPAGRVIVCVTVASQHLAQSAKKWSVRAVWSSDGCDGVGGCEQTPPEHLACNGVMRCTRTASALAVHCMR